MIRGSLTVLAVVMAALVWSGCGGAKAEMSFTPVATVFAPADGKVGSNTFKVAMASTTIDRIRVQKLVDLSADAGQAAVLVYGGFEGKEAPLSLSPDFNHPADLVFVNKDKKVVKLYASDDMHYVPFGGRTPASNWESSASAYSSGEPASVLLALPRGKAAASGISVGSTVDISPDPYAAVAKADPNGIELFFRTRKLKDPDVNEIADPVKLVAPLAITAEDRARGLVEGQNALVMLYQHEDTSWQSGGFWLKGKAGEYSVAFMRLQQGTNGGPQSFTGVVLDVVEGIKDSDAGTTDLNRAAWWPSGQRVQVMDEVSPTTRHGQVQGPVNAILVVRGKNAFETLGITEDMWILGSPLTLQTPGTGIEGNRVEKDDLKNGLFGYAAGDRRPIRVLQTQSDIDAAASGVLLYREGTMTLFAFDSEERAAIRNYRANEAKVALLRHTADNNYAVDRVETLGGRQTEAKALENAPSRFAVLLTDHVKLSAGDTVTLPWLAHNVRPTLGRGAFWKGRPGNKQSTHAPTDSKVVTLEVAQTEADISRGLMFRKSLPENHGMLFIFPKADNKDFWMKNCEMDIDVAFVTEDFTISVIRNMKVPAPGTRESDLELYSSRRRVLYAVEMEGGWFAKNGVVEGDRLWLPPSLRQRSTK